MVEGGSAVLTPAEARPGQPTLRWQSRARSLEAIQRELARIWARPPGAVPSGEDAVGHVAARTSVLNLVVVVRRPEIGMRSAATVSQLTGRHPSRTMVIASVDPDGPAWLDAQIQAFCVVPRPGAAETCGEMIYLTAGGESGRHLQSLVAPLLIHDLPVTLWLPGEPIFDSPATRELADMSDRLVVDGSHWNGTGLVKLAQVAELAEGRIAISDFALMRQSRWREAIAATFDVPELTPFLRSIRRIEVTYATHDETGNPTSTNVVKPVYHVAWIGGRLGMHVERPLMPVTGAPRLPVASAPTTAVTPGGAGKVEDMSHHSNRDTDELPGPAHVPGGFDARLRHGSAEVVVELRPRLSGMPEGTTLRLDLIATRRGTELRTAITAEAETVHCRVWQNDVLVLERRFNSARRIDVDLLAEAIESTNDDRIERETIRMAGRIVAPRAGGVPL